MQVTERDPELEGEPRGILRWVAAGLVATAALLGSFILVALIVVALEPPVWVQMVLGVIMAAGTAFLAWLVAAALGRNDDERRRG